MPTIINASDPANTLDLKVYKPPCRPTADQLSDYQRVAEAVILHLAVA
jgi:hypothetical protein